MVVDRADNLRDPTDARFPHVAHDLIVLGNDPAKQWIALIAIEETARGGATAMKWTLGEASTIDRRFAEETGIDPDLAFALIAETISEAERTFARTTDGRALERFALVAAIDLLSGPPRVHDFLPALAVNQAWSAVAAR